MGGLSGFVLKRKKLIIVLWVIITVVFSFCFLFTSTNYNIMKYLPDQANSTVAINLMQDEFGQPLPNLKIMVEDVSLAEAEDIKEEIKQSESVEEVLWLDDTVDIKQPLEVQDKATVEAYYKDGNALYTVTVTDGEERAAIDSIRENLAGNCKFSGNAADQASGQELAMEETSKALIILVPALIAILILFSESWIEPLFYIITLVVSVLVNLGSNIFMGEISYVTLGTAPILQIAVSLDYSVFLAHCYKGHRTAGLSVENALGAAIKESGKSVLASMLTTLFGFFALIFMQYTIGADMGIVLIKGILISFICSLTLFPALLVSGEKLVTKTQHRRIVPQFKTIGNGIVKARIPLLIIIIAIMIPAFLASGQNNFFYGRYDKTPVESELYEIEQAFGTDETMVLLVPSGDSVSETELCRELKDIDHITSVTSYATMVSNKIPEAYLDSSVTDQFYSDNYARIILSTDAPVESEESFRMVEEMRALADRYYPGECYSCGQNPNMYDLRNCIQTDNTVVEWITIISIYIVLLLMTKNFVTPALLIITIKCSIWLNMSIPYFSGDGLSYMGYLIVSTIQMGATVDYAIFLTNTYKDNRLLLPPQEAMKKSIGQAFSSILISCIMLTICGFALAFSSTDAVIQVLGSLLGRGALLAIVMVMLLLPTLLLLFEKITDHTGFGRKKV